MQQAYGREKKNRYYIIMAFMMYYNMPIHFEWQYICDGLWHLFAPKTNSVLSNYFLLFISFEILFILN